MRPFFVSEQDCCGFGLADLFKAKPTRAGEHHADPNQ